MLRKGEVINGCYQVLQEIGKGSMGVVYLAMHLRLHKYVVMKKVKAGSMTVQQICIEADALKDVRHSCIPQVYDVFPYHGDVYTVMDYIEGYDLKCLMESGCYYSQEELTKWLRQICSALQTLHRHQPPIVHSDIKPENILIDENGDACLIDFNIAGGYGLTLEYASPEQYTHVCLLKAGDPRAQQYPIDGRSDIYSLGATFYYLITLQKQDVRKMNLPKLTAYEQLPFSEAFLEIIDKMRSPDLTERFQSAQEVLEALETVKKRDFRYRRYIIFQIIGALIFTALIVIGVRLILKGNAKIVEQHLSQDYQAVTELCQKGDYEQAIRKGNDFLNEPDYHDLITDKEKGELFYLMGNCAYNENDYKQAVSYFKEAYRYKDLLDEPGDLYLDYAVSLAKNDELDEAVRILEEARAAQYDHPSLILAQAEIAYVRGEYQTALEQALSCYQSTADPKKKARCCVLAGDICHDAAQYQDSITYYEKALSLDEKPDTLRKCAGEHILYNNSRHTQDAVTEQNLKSAEKHLNRLLEQYVPSYEDYLNLGKISRSTGNYSLSVRSLKEGLKHYPKDFRMNLYLALTCQAMEDYDGARQYVGKAMEYSQGVDQNSVDYRDFRTLYDMYY